MVHSVSQQDVYSPNMNPVSDKSRMTPCCVLCQVLSDLQLLEEDLHQPKIVGCFFSQVGNLKVHDLLSEHASGDIVYISYGQNAIKTLKNSNRNELIRQTSVIFVA